MTDQLYSTKNTQIAVPYVSVIIPTYRDWKRLQLCLDALAIQTYPTDHFEIIVINNDPDDVIPDYVELPKNCMVVTESKPGSYAARNKGLSVARGKIYAFTDSDCQPEKNWLMAAVSFLDENQDYARVGGKIQLYTENKKFNWFEIYELFFAFPQEKFVKNEGMAATANMVSRKEAFNEVGWFDEKLMSGGDVEWGVRANNRGLKIHYHEQSVVFHPTRKTFKEIMLKTRRIAGGHYARAKEKSIAAIVLLLLKGLVPPIYAIRAAAKTKNESLLYKIIAIVVAVYLKYIAFFELLRIAVTKNEVERF